MRDLFEDTDERPQFAGHETFPLRLLWLKKAYDAVKDGAAAGLFQEPSAIARFGVGRNMAVAMRYWALASGFVEENARTLRPTALGAAILDDEGLDPFIERAATVWLVHWHLARDLRMTTTTYYAFNALTGIEFDPGTIVEELVGHAAVRAWRVTRSTLKRDVDVLLRGYVRREGAGEDAAEPLLAELGLIREAKLGGWYEFVRGPKPSLPDGIFAYALSAFWAARRSGSSAVTAEQVCYAPGSPGRVFKLDEDSVVTRLMRIGDVTEGAWLWTDTAGLRQVQKVRDLDPLVLVATAYPRSASIAEAA